MMDVSIEVTDDALAAAEAARVEAMQNVACACRAAEAAARRVATLKALRQLGEAAQALARADGRLPARISITIHREQVRADGD